MATIEFIEKRIAGKEKELDKLTKKLERIRKAEAGNWEVNNPYYYGPSDLRYTLNDIALAEKALEDYKAQLAAEAEKAASRNVPVILEFLEIWKDKVRKFYGDGLRQYFEESAAVRAITAKASSFGYLSPEYEEIKKVREAFYKKRHGYYEKRVYEDRWGKNCLERVKVRNGEYEYLAPYCDERSLEEAIAKLEKDIAREADRKYDFIIERTNRIVGTITDAAGLYIGSKQDLNGYIVGTKGTAKVQTIGAGGYNIQCFHFRTLINELK